MDVKVDYDTINMDYTPPLWRDLVKILTRKTRPQYAEDGCYYKKKGSIENSSNSKNLA